MAQKDSSPKNTFHFTPEGLAEIKQEYDELVNVKRPKLVERLSNARSMGDLSENNDYFSAREELTMLDGRISELEQVLKNAVVIRKKTSSPSVILGAKVTVGTNGQRHIFHIVGEWEADPQNKKISGESPLGRALIGKRVGEEVEIEAPAGKIVYKILSIE